MIPVFTSHYSVGRSILTLDDPTKIKNWEASSKDTWHGPSSIIKICNDNQIKNLYLVDTRMSGYLEAYENCKKYDLNLRFGLELKICDDPQDKEDKNIHKFIIFILNYQGYKDLLRINNRAFCEQGGKTTLKDIREFWTENLSLVIPFYGSYIHKNLTTFSSISFDISDLNPFYFWENHSLPFDQLIQKKIQKDRDNVIKSHRIYYNKKEDFINYLTYRCIHKRAKVESPNINDFGSKEFCFESYQELLKNE